MRRLAILGASGHGKVVADAALASGWDEVVFYDDQWPEKLMVAHWPVVGNSSMLIGQAAGVTGAIVGIGGCAARAAMHAALRDSGMQMETIVHPRAWISPNAVVGGGSVIVAGAVINIGATIGEACIVNTGATVDHDCVLGLAVHVAPGANVSGGVVVGDRSWIGVGACVRQGVRIGADVVVGAGGVVVAEVGNGQVVYGSPARPQSSRNGI